jgi:hypothetical protein
MQLYDVDRGLTSRTYLFEKSSAFIDFSLVVNAGIDMELANVRVASYASTEFPGTGSFKDLIAVIAFVTVRVRIGQNDTTLGQVEL